MELKMPDVGKEKKGKKVKITAKEKHYL